MILKKGMEKNDYFYYDCECKNIMDGFEGMTA